ncbi:MAG TPA: hypothetical protein VFC63_26970 [Blastocatellia bacterium]|nr:hypothetical protein [Blastocatellia bacterium]
MYCVVNNRFYKSARKSLAAVAILLCLSYITLGQESDKKHDKKDSDAAGTPIIWEDPGDLASRNLFYGRGSEDRAPKPPFTFVEEDMSGSNPKFDVTDANGTKWKVKLGNEAQPETTVSHLLWAVGYFTDEDYYVPEFNVQGLKKLHRGNDLVGKDGTVHGGRFKRQNKGEKNVGEWKWDKNPFLGTKEFQGLKVMMMLFNNWDIKDVNNKIFRVEDKNDGRTELRYEVSDLGASLGKTGGFFTRSRNKPDDFVKTKFIEDVKRPFIEFNFNGKKQDLFTDIRVEQARWIGTELAKLSDQQINDAFRAGGYAPDEIQVMTEALKTRITELSTLPE